MWRCLRRGTTPQKLPRKNPRSHGGQTATILPCPPKGGTRFLGTTCHPGKYLFPHFNTTTIHFFALYSNTHAYNTTPHSIKHNMEDYTALNHTHQHHNIHSMRELWENPGLVVVLLTRIDRYCCCCCSLSCLAEQLCPGFSHNSLVLCML